MATNKIMNDLEVVRSSMSSSLNKTGDLLKKIMSEIEFVAYLVESQPVAADLLAMTNTKFAKAANQLVIVTEFGDKEKTKGSKRTICFNRGLGKVLEV